LLNYVHPPHRKFNRPRISASESFLHARPQAHPPSTTPFPLPPLCLELFSDAAADDDAIVFLPQVEISLFSSSSLSFFSIACQEGLFSCIAGLKFSPRHGSVGCFPSAKGAIVLGGVACGTIFSRARYGDLLKRSCAPLVKEFSPLPIMNGRVFLICPSAGKAATPNRLARARSLSLKTR